MADNNKFGGWTSVINSVKTPLGFFALIALILDAVLLGTSALTSKIQMWAPLALLGFLIVGVFVIVMFKPLVLYHPSEWPVEKRMKAYLLFPTEAIKVNLEVRDCRLYARDKNGCEKPAVTPNLVFDHGAWSFLLPANIDDTDSVRLELTEKGNRKWNTKPFTPYDTNVEAFQTN